jgi:N-succinyldiaminopimelate aminotransferase
MTTTHSARLTKRLQAFGTSVFAEFTPLARRYDAVDLGQGFPDFDAPEFLREAAQRAIGAGHNQYAPLGGVRELTQAIAEHQRRFYDLEYDPASEVTVTAGATEALFSAIQALLDPGDEALVLAPLYDSYLPGLSLAGALPRIVSLEPPDFRYDPAAVEAAIGPRTRLVILNSPHNPAGTLLDSAALEHLARMARDRDLVVICDEVYEHIVFEGSHTPLATFPGMRERTLTISSAGKTFSVTGWKIGWACGAPELTQALRAAHQFTTFCIATPLQHAVAEGLAAPDAFYDDLREGYRARRDRLCDGLAALGLNVLRPAGTYFVLADVRPLGFDDDLDFCRMLPERVGVAAIPASAFFPNREVRHLVRFAFCKTDAVLDEGLKRLKGLRQ